MTPKRTAECPACSLQVRAFIIKNNVVKVGHGHDDDPRRRCIDCWERGREPAKEVCKTVPAGALAPSEAECHSVCTGSPGAPAPTPAQGSGR